MSDDNLVPVPEYIPLLTTDVPQGYIGTMRRNNSVMMTHVSDSGGLADIWIECEDRFRRMIAASGFNAAIGVSYSHSPIFQANGQQRDVVGWSVVVYGHAIKLTPPLNSYTVGPPGSPEST